MKEVSDDRIEQSEQCKRNKMRDGNKVSSLLLKPIPYRIHNMSELNRTLLPSFLTNK